jgi:hypothetical protein
VHDAKRARADHGAAVKLIVKPRAEAAAGWGEVRWGGVGWGGVGWGGVGWGGVGWGGVGRAAVAMAAGRGGVARAGCDTGRDTRSTGLVVLVLVLLRLDATLGRCSALAPLPAGGCQHGASLHVPLRLLLPQHRHREARCTHPNLYTRCSCVPSTPGCCCSSSCTSACCCKPALHASLMLLLLLLLVLCAGRGAEHAPPLRHAGPALPQRVGGACCGAGLPAAAAAVERGCCCTPTALMRAVHGAVLCRARQNG